jgi:hypothetical protein
MFPKPNSFKGNPKCEFEKSLAVRLSVSEDRECVPTDM